MKIVVGLGNYGEQYALTYHNMGFMAAELLANKLGFKFKDKECDSLVAIGNYDGDRVLIAKPLTYMNLSGVAVKQLLKKYTVEPSDLIVVFDDIDIEKGTIRRRMNGSAGTHNGMRSIVSSIKSEDFKRVKIGIGRPREGVDLADYVLSSVAKADRSIMQETIDDAVNAIIDLLAEKNN